MASGTVCFSLRREFAIKQMGIKKPSAALIKAMLINGAQNIGGQYVPSEAGVIPNCQVPADH